MTAPCTSCLVAEQQPDTGLYQAGCGECAARALAQSPEHHKAATVRRMVPEYRAALARVAGTDKAGVCDALHQRVKAWARRIDEFKRHRAAA